MTSIAKREWRVVVVIMLLSIFFFTPGRAQLWNRTYIEDRPVLLFSSVLKSDNNYYVTGVTTDKGGFTNFDRAFMGKLDENGNVTQYKTITDSAGKTYSAYFNTLIKDNQGKLVFTGYSLDSVARLLLVKTDESLNNIQVYEYTTPNTSAFQGRSMLQHTDGYYYVTGVRTVQSMNNASVVLLKVDSNGNRLWEKLYNQDKIDYAESIISLSNGNLMLGAYRTNINQTNEIANTWLLEVDTGGGIQRQWFDPNDSTYTAKGLLQTGDGGFIYAAQKKNYQSVNDVYKTIIVVKHDSLFNTQWIFTGGVMGNFTGIVDIEILPDGNYIACGNYSNRFGWVIKLASDGSLLWDRKYEGIIDTNAVWNILSDIDVLADGSFIAVGQCQRLVNPNQLPPQVGWFLKLDSNGCEIENCIMGIDAPKSPKGDLNSQIQIYPNPFTSDISIVLTGGHVSAATYTITNLTGQTVYHQTESNLATGYTKMLDLSYLPHGVYFVEVSTDEGKMVQRIVKQ